MLFLFVLFFVVDDGGSPDTPPPPHQYTAADLDNYLRERNIQFSNDPASEYQITK